MTSTETGALEAMLDHHRQLDEGVGRRVAALAGAVDGGAAHEPAVAQLTAFLADEVLPHALAEEHTLYPAAGGRPGLSAAIAELVAEHRTLATGAEELASSRSGEGAADRARAIGALFSEHVKKENELVLPALAADPTVDLDQLLVRMHRLGEAALDDRPLTGDDATPDPEAALVSLLVEATAELARAGQGDRACRLAAAAWSAVRVSRPELGVRVTAALHHLVRLAASEPVPFRPTAETTRTASGTAGGRTDGAAGGPELDVRPIAHGKRHDVIFATYRGLGPGTAFVLVNDHDPKPLRYQFESRHGDEFTWDYVESGPDVWRVRIGRVAAGGTP